MERVKQNCSLSKSDSAGGSAKQARDRKTQAILPIRGKILNVASATADKIRANAEIADLTLAMGCGTRKDCDPENLRYDRIIIMTDADVDGAHIATLLMTFFFQEMPEVVRRGHLFLAQPPLYRLTAGKESRYARDDAHRAELEETVFKGKKVEVARFKGLGEMNPGQLRETTMNPDTRSLIRITLPQEFEGPCRRRTPCRRADGPQPRAPLQLHPEPRQRRGSGFDRRLEGRPLDLVRRVDRDFGRAACKRADLTNETGRFRHGEVAFDRFAILPTLEEMHEVGIVSTNITVVRNAAGFGAGSLGMFNA